ncbi:MAG: energy transducer TonB, partial [Bacteroidales bacterium]|nr:energy transducer TonB [Bacteroidales bacterium]
EKEKEKEDPIPYQLLEEKPSFQGGDANQFSKWVYSQLVYPSEARMNGVQGRVILKFIIETDGSVSEIRVLRSPDSSLSKEAVRLLSMSPKWEPGKMRGKPVRVEYTFSMIFQLR